MKHFTRVLAVIVLGFGLTAASFHDAEAGRGRHGGLIVGAIIGGLALGAIASQNRYRDDYRYDRHDYRYRSNYRYRSDYGYGGDYCYRGPRRCRSRYRCFVDDYGNEHCRNVRSCYRPVICD